MSVFRPQLSENLVRELHRAALKENRSLTNMCEVAIKSGLRAMENLRRPWERAEPTKPADAS
jgi:hypothetical protein